jgi:hypothetical protein
MIAPGAEKSMMGSSSGKHLLKDENDDLKKQLQLTQTRVQELEKLLKGRIAHENQLRDSIMQVMPMIIKV